MAQTGQTCWEMGEAPSTHPKTLRPKSGVGHLTLFQAASGTPRRECSAKLAGLGKAGNDGEAKQAGESHLQNGDKNITYLVTLLRLFSQQCR